MREVASLAMDLRDRKRPRLHGQGLNLDCDDESDNKAMLSEGSQSASGPSTFQPFTLPEKSWSHGILLVNGKQYNLESEHGVVSDRKLTYTIIPEQNSIQLQTPYKEDKRASRDEKANVLAGRAKLRKELSVALMNNEKELNRLIHAKNTTYDEKAIVAVTLERGRIQYALNAVQEGVRNTYNCIWKGQNVTAKAVKCPVWVVNDADLSHEAGEVVDRRTNRLSSEKYARKWGSQGDNDGEFRYPCGIFISGSAEANGSDGAEAGEVYVSDREKHHIAVFSKDGTFLRKWGVDGYGDAEFKEPFGIIVEADSEGKMEVYVSDLGNPVIQVFDTEGNFIRKFGSGGTGDGQLLGTSGMCMGTGDNGETELYVCDGQNHRIQVFDKQGKFLRKWGSEGNGEGQFEVPNFVCFLDGKETINPAEVYVSDFNNHRIQVFDKQGRFLRKWGSEGSGDGQFQRPYGMCLRKYGQKGDAEVYVCDRDNHRIQVFDKDGNFLRKWGNDDSDELFPDDDGELDAPISICISTHSNGEEEVFVTERNNCRIQVFR